MINKILIYLILFFIVSGVAGAELYTISIMKDQIKTLQKEVARNDISNSTYIIR